MLHFFGTPCIRFDFQSKWEMIHEKWRIQTKTWAMFNFPYFLLTSKRFICDKDKGVEFDSIKTRRQKQMDEFRRERTNFSANSIRRKFLEAEWTNWKTTKTLPFVQICGWSVGWGKSFNFLFSLSEIMAAAVLSFTLVTSFLWSQLVAILLLMWHWQLWECTTHTQLFKMSVTCFGGKITIFRKVHF